MRQGRNRVGLEAIDAVMKEHASPALNDRGNVLAKLGNLEQEPGNFEAAEARYSEALSAFAAAIESSRSTTSTSAIGEARW